VIEPNMEALLRGYDEIKGGTKWRKNIV
jgi:hypothetical protein